MKMIAAGGRQLETYEQLQSIVRELDGKPVDTVWSAVDDSGRPTGNSIAVDVGVRPTYQVLWYAELIPDVDQNVETGLLGLTPLVRISAVHRGRNQDVLLPGDVILKAGSINGPRYAQLRGELAQRRGGEIDMVLLRDGREVELTADVDRKGHLNIDIGLAWDLPLIAEPMSRLRAEGSGGSVHSVMGTGESIDSPVAGLMLMGRSRLDAVNDTPVTDWSSFNDALRRNTQGALQAGISASITLTITHPTPGKEQETLILDLSADEVAGLGELTWTSDLSPYLFEPMYTMLTAAGNPARAAIMGFQETWKVVVMTYLTIDRLVRGSVGVEQIRGPVGIVHIGAQVADRGMTYLVFFLGIISVNLAVINFLPIPIVDGGLFLFLIYEKLKGQPPPIAVQNAATILGVALIATALLVVTWNDLMRLVS